MIDEDARPPKKAEPQSLETLSIDELEARIVTLKSEIARCEEAIRQKRSVKNAADAFFKSPPN
jgi:uncharacterized small protein (DUF1192 family)